jgi:hypothetical protein
MKSMYREEDWRYTQEAEDLDRMTNKAVRHIFQHYLDMGFNAREIAHVICAVITDFELGAILDKRSANNIPVVAYPKEMCLSSITDTEPKIC